MFSIAVCACQSGVGAFFVCRSGLGRDRPRLWGEALHRGQARSYRHAQALAMVECEFVGAALAAMGRRCGARRCIAGKPAPTGMRKPWPWWSASLWERPWPRWGVDVGRGAASRASPLLQACASPGHGGVRVCGSGLGRDGPRLWGQALHRGQARSHRASLAPGRSGALKAPAAPPAAPAGAAAGWCAPARPASAPSARRPATCRPAPARR